MTPGIGQQPARFEALRTPQIGDAADAVQRLLDDGGLGWVSRSEARDAAGRLAALDPQAADSVVDELARRGQLDRLAAEVMDRAWVGPGLTADQRADFMRDMAGRLDGESLARLSEAFARTDPGTGGFEPVTELAAAVARHASPQARLAYLHELAAHATDRPHHAVGGALQLDGQRRLGDAEARAVAEVLRSFRSDPAMARAALEAVHAVPGALDAVMAAAMDTEQDWGLLNGWHTAGADRSAYRDLMQTASAMAAGHRGTADEAATQALADAVFAAAGRVIDPRDVNADDLVFHATPLPPDAARLAGIADAVYARTGAPEGATRIDDRQLAALGIDPALLSKPEIGFEAGLYALDEGGWVLAFRGTDDWGLARRGDTDDNLAQGLGYGSLQHTAAAIAAMEVAAIVGSDALHLTGHSLGGGLAATAAGRSGLPAVTFNAAGVAAETVAAYTLSFAAGQVTNYRTTGDIMSHLNGGPAPTRYADLLGLDRLRQFPPAVGTQVDLGNPLARLYLDQRLESWWIPSVREGAQFGGAQHLMDEVLRHATPQP